MREHKSLLNLIYSNEVILDDLRKLFDEVSDKHKPMVDRQTDETLGQEYRAYIKAKDIVSDTFNELRMLKDADTTANGIKYK